MAEDMNKIFNNLEFIARLVEKAVENGEPLPKDAAEKAAAFNAAIQKCAEKSLLLRK